MYYDIGLLLKKLREENGVSLQKISNGLCSFISYREIENGLCFPDIRLLRLLMERLGKSFNKLEIIVNTKTYEAELMQYRFNTAVGKNNEKEAEKLIRKMEKSKAEAGKVSEMYYYRNLANYYFLKGKMKEATESIEQALDCTMPLWRSNKFLKMVLSTTEIENLIIYIFLILKDRDEVMSGLLAVITEYLEEYEIDEEEKAVLIPKLCYVKALCRIREGDDAAAAELCKQGFEMLRKHEILFLMPALLEIIVKYDSGNENTEYKDYLSALNTVFEMYPEFSADYYYNSLFMRCKKTLYHLDSEVIRGLRKQKNISQVKLSEDIYKNPISFNRAETGKTSMNTEYFRALMDRLKVGKDRLNFSLVCMNYEALELLHETMVSAVKNDKEAVERTLSRINELVDTNLDQNERTLKRFQNMAKLMSSEDIDSIREESGNFLHENYPILEKETGRPPFYDESQAIAQLEACLYQENNKEMERKLLEVTLDEFNKSNVDRYFQFKTYGVLQRNYVNCLAEAREEAEKTIKYGLTVGSSGDLYSGIWALGYEILEKDKNSAEAERYLRLANQLVKLVGRERDIDNLQQLFYEKFGTKI